jgi:hypothetical protein
MATASVQVRSLQYHSFNNRDIPNLYSSPDNVRNIQAKLDGFPAQYVGERVWTGSDMALKQNEWIATLSHEEQNQILSALRHFQSLDLPPASISPQTFPLPQALSARLRKISQDIHNGRGFSILRGLRPELFTDEENVLVFAGVSAHVALRRGFQDIKRELITCHVVSEELKPGAYEQKLRPAFTNGPVAFHTDMGDILALYAMDLPEAGGGTMIASSSKIYNELAASRPDLLEELTQKWTFCQSQNYELDGTPLLNNTVDDKLVMQYSRLPVTGFRNEGPNTALPPPSPLRLEAMETIERLAWQHGLELPRERGDIAFINNFCLLHARQAFDTDPDGTPLPSKRHLVKLVLQDPDLMWKIPESLSWISEQLFGANTEDGRRVEKWQLSIKPESLPDGMIWVASGGTMNG